MKIRTTLFALLLVLTLCGKSRAEPIVWDDLLKAVAQAGKELATGTERKEVLGHLNQAIEENPKSRHLEHAQRLRDDLSDSIARVATSPKGEKALMETTIPLSVIALSSNWDRPRRQFMDKNPRDPMTTVLRNDRGVIDALLPLLHDRSPTRSCSDYGLGVPRVCDIALLTIEYFSKCRFHSNASSPQQFQELSPADRDKTIRQIEKWWEDNKAKTVAEGIRAQLPNGDFQAKLWMAVNLARLGDKAEENPDRAYAIEVLRTLFRENRGYAAVYAAYALAEVSDFSPVDEFYNSWKNSIDGKGRIYDSHVVFYLTDYGTRREWELLHTLAEREIEQEPDIAKARIWPALVNCSKAGTSPYAIPGVALALTHTTSSGGRESEDSVSQPSYIANNATAYLQKLTEHDFGYRRDDSPEKRAAAIKEARRWWSAEGRRRFTFDYIETVMVKGANRLPGTDPAGQTPPPANR